MTGAERGPTDFGRYLLYLMDGKNIYRQIQLGEVTGISAPTISRLIYSDKYAPDVRTLKRLSDALDVPVADLVARWSGDLKSPKTLPPALAEIADLLGDDSTLPPDERRNLEVILRTLAASYRGIAQARKTV